jgi:hypothetical protein
MLRLGENPVRPRRTTAALLASFPPWRRQLLRPRSVAVMPTLPWLLRSL